MKVLLFLKIVKIQTLLKTLKISFHDLIYLRRKLKFSLYNDYLKKSYKSHNKEEILVDLIIKKHFSRFL